MSRNAKYVTFKAEESAEENGRKAFNTESGKIIIRIVKEALENEEGMAVALFAPTEKDLDAVNNMDGFFRLAYLEDGVYFELYPSLGRGVPVNREDISRFVARKGISGFSAPNFLPVMEQGFGRTKVGPPQAENVLDQDLAVAISPDGMEAKCSLLPGDEQGALLDEEGVNQKLLDAGVRFGINKIAVNYMLKEQKFSKSYILAKGAPPQNGKDGSLEFHFRRVLSAAPKVVDEKTDSVDYRLLDLFEPCTAGQVLVSRIPATPGVPGSRVTGEELAPKAGKEAVLPRGKNITYNEDKTKLMAASSGMVRHEQGAVNVFNVYQVKGNCDMSTGNIIFDGNVEVKGSVISGMTIEASGAVIVDGVVEGATIISGSDIVLKSGIQGLDKGKLKAAGSIKARFIERASLQAGGNVVADTIIHSHIAVGGNLNVKDNKGAFVGGSARVAGDITVKVLGTSAHTSTIIEVGILLSTLDRIDFLKKELTRITLEIDKLFKLQGYLEKGRGLDEGRTKLYNSVKESLFLSDQLMAEHSIELNHLEEEVKSAANGKVHVLDTCYPGVRIGIASSKMLVSRPVPFATFKYGDGEIVFGPCEAK